MQLPTAISALVAGGDRHPNGKPLGREDVALLAVGVVQQGDVGGAVGVVLDRGDLRGHTVLATLEVDPPVQTLGAATTVAGRLATVGVASTALLQAFHERALGLCLGDLGEVRVGGEAPTGARGLGLANWHRWLLVLKAL